MAEELRSADVIKEGSAPAKFDHATWRFAGSHGGGEARTLERGGGGSGFDDDGLINSFSTTSLI